jgi:outer membrane protein TolC
VSQVIELGGKPEARATLAGAQHGTEAAQVRLTRLAVLSTVALDFARLVHLQERRSNLAARLENASVLEQAIAARVEAGKDSALQLRQYQLQLSLSRFDLQELDRAVTAARARLASHWGSREPRFRVAVGRFSVPWALPSPPSSGSAWTGTPSWRCERPRSPNCAPSGSSSAGSPPRTWN